MRITDVSKLRGPLGELNGQLLGDNGEERLTELNLWLKKVTVRVLKHLRDVALGPIEKFVAKDVFTTKNKDVKFYDFGSNFKKLFRDLVENPVSAATISVSQLLNGSKDSPIRTELGNDHEITLGQFYEMLKVLPHDGTWFVAYIVGNDGNVWAVNAGWYSFLEGWGVDAYSVGDSYGWDAGNLMLSRKLAA